MCVGRGGGWGAAACRAAHIAQSSHQGHPTILSGEKFFVSAVGPVLGWLQRSRVKQACLTIPCPCPFSLGARGLL